MDRGCGPNFVLPQGRRSGRGGGLGLWGLLAAAAGGLYENSKPLQGLEFLAARSICSCCSVEVAEGGGGCGEFLLLGVRFLLANPHHMTKTATTNSNVEAALPASELLRVEIL